MQTPPYLDSKTFYAAGLSSAHALFSFQDAVALLQKPEDLPLLRQLESWLCKPGRIATLAPLAQKPSLFEDILAKLDLSRLPFSPQVSFRRYPDQGSFPDASYATLTVRLAVQDRDNPAARIYIESTTTLSASFLRREAEELPGPITDQFLHLVFKEVLRAITHEVGELFVFNNGRPFDPHKNQLFKLAFSTATSGTP